MVLHAQRGAAKVAISRMGELAQISAPTPDDVDKDGSTVNDYGKVERESWEQVGAEPVVRIYQSGSEPGQARVLGGRTDTERPRLIMYRETVARAGYRVDYRGTTFEIDSLTTFPTHVEAETTLVG